MKVVLDTLSYSINIACLFRNVKLKKVKIPFDNFRLCAIVHIDMNIRDTLPKQAEIEDFLGREFFPKYPLPLPLKEAVDMAQLEFEVSDEARALPVPRGHASSFEGGTVLECLTYFAILRLQERGFIVRTGENMFLRIRGRKYFGKVDRKMVNEALVSFNILRNQPVYRIMNLLRDRWPEDVISAAKEKFNLTISNSVLG